MASRFSLVSFRDSFCDTSRPLAAVTAKLVAGCIATVLVAGCNDPELEKQAAFERQFNEVAAEYAKTLGGRPDLLSTNPSDESITALRAVADKAKGLSGGSAGQQTAARSLAASVYRTSASIELARAAWLESGEEIVRGLVLSASGLAADLEAVASSAEGMDLSSARGKADAAKSNGAKSMRALQESVRQLEGPASQLNDQISKSSARLSELGQEVAVLLRKARESSATAGLALVEEAAGIKTEARGLARKTAENQIAAESMMAESRLVSAQLREAQGLQAAATAALDLMNGFEADIDGQATKCRELASELRRSADTLMKSIADERAGALNAAYEAASTDLANAAADADSDALRHTLTCEELRMHVTRITGLGAQGRMLASASGAGASGLTDLKSAAETAIAALKEKATAAADQFANMGEDPATAGLKTYADGVKKMADALTVDMLMNPPSPQKAASSSGRSGAGAATAGGDDLDAIVAKLNDAASDPATSAKMFIDLVDDSNANAKAMKDMMSSVMTAMQPLMEAMAEKFGAESLATLGGGMGGVMGGGMASPGSMGKLTKKSNDGSTAVYSTEKGDELTFVKTSSGWKVDMLSQMDPAQAEMMAQVAPMMGMMIGPMKKACTDLAAKIRSGEITSADEVQGALQQAMMQGMGGGRGGLGGGGAGREGDN